MIEDQEFYWTLLDTLKDGVYFADSKRKITYWNKGAEVLTGYKSPEVLGKFCSDNILIHIDDHGNNLCAGHCPLAEVLKTGIACEARVHLHHKKGHRVPVQIRVNPVIDKNGKIIGAVEVFRDRSANELLIQRLQQLASLDLVDNVTNLPNRRFVEMTIETRLEEFKKYQQPFGVLYFRIAAAAGSGNAGNAGAETKPGTNSTTNGDRLQEVLKIAARTFVASFSPFDVVGHWEEGEFIGVFAGVNWEKLAATGEVYRVLLKASDFSAVGIVPVLTIGSALGQADDRPQSLVERARQRAQ